MNAARLLAIALGLSALASPLDAQDGVRQQLQLRRLRERLAETKRRYEQLVRLRVAHSLLLDVSEAELVAGTEPADLSRRAEIEKELAELARSSQDLTLRLASLRESVERNPDAVGPLSRPSDPRTPRVDDRGGARSQIGDTARASDAIGVRRTAAPARVEGPLPGVIPDAATVHYGPRQAIDLSQAPLREAPIVLDPLAARGVQDRVVYLAPANSAFKRALALQRAGLPRQSLVVLDVALEKRYESSLAFLRARAFELAGLRESARSAYAEIATPPEDAGPAPSQGATDGAPDPWVEAAKSAIAHLDWLTTLASMPLPTLEDLDW